MEPLARSIFTRVVAVVVIASVALGWFFGASAGAAYALLNYRLWEPPEGPTPFTVPDLSSIGSALGMAGVLVVSVLWCRHMLRARTRMQDSSLMWRGGLLGVGAGLTSTAIVHVGLISIMALDGNRPFKPLLNPVPIIIGIACGTGAGAILGCIGAALCGREVQGPDCPRHESGGAGVPPA